MNAFIITEGPSDVAFLQKVLPSDLISDVRFIPASGIEGVKSTARSIIATSYRPVAILIDAGTADPELVEERRQSVEEVVRGIGTSVPFRVILATPELEATFFEATGPLLRTYPEALNNPMILTLASLNARKAFEAIAPSIPFETIRDSLIRNIREEDIASFQGTNAIRELIDSLRGSESRRVKLRLEIGPGIPSDLDRLKSGSGWKALVAAMTKILSFETDDGVVSATDENTTVFCTVKSYRGGMEPPGALPTTFVFEYEIEARTETQNGTGHGSDAG